MNHRQPQFQQFALAYLEMETLADSKVLLQLLHQLVDAHENEPYICLALHKTSSVFCLESVLASKCGVFIEL